MIRSFVRCTSICYTKLLVNRTNYVIPAIRHISSSVDQRNSKAKNRLKENSTTEESTLNVDHAAMANFVMFLRNKLNCPRKRAEELCIAYPEMAGKNLSELTKNLELLVAEGVRDDVILDSPRMLTVKYEHLRANLDIVNGMKPKNINDFVALVQLSTAKLMKLKRRANSEENVVPNGHRIYYMSDVMHIEPPIITKFIQLRLRLFVLEFSFKILSQNLQTLLSYHIAPIDILHDLWVLRYAPDIIEHRLNQAKLGGIEKLMPWMVHCTEKSLLKTIKITAETKAIVGDESRVKYLSDRLKYDVKATEAIMEKHPQVYNVRVTQMKEILDYLFAAGFSAADIARTPRIFCHSLQTTKKRLDELKSLGCRPKSLVVVCKSANEYDKFVKHWNNIREEFKEKNIIKE